MALSNVKLRDSFYLTFNFLAGIDLDWGIGNYRIFSDRVAVGFRQMREQMRFFPASLSYTGLNVGTVVLPHDPRQEGADHPTHRTNSSLWPSTRFSPTRRCRSRSLRASGYVCRCLQWPSQGWSRRAQPSGGRPLQVGQASSSRSLRSAGSRYS